MPPETHARILALVAEGATYAAIKAATGASHDTIARACRAANVPPPARQASRLPPETVARIEAAILAGSTDLGIARDVGCNEAAVARRRRKMGVEPRPVGKRRAWPKKVSP